MSVRVVTGDVVFARNTVITVGNGQVTIDGGQLADAVQGSGQRQTQVRQLLSVPSRLEVRSVGHVVIETGDALVCEVSCDDNLLEHVVTEVEGGCLRIFVQGCVRLQSALMVKVVIPPISSLELGGSVQIEYRAVSTPHLECRVSGSSSAHLAGQCDEFKLVQSGASEVHAMGLTTRMLDAKVSGAASAWLVSTEAVSIGVSGSASASISGNPLRRHASCGRAATLNWF